LNNDFIKITRVQKSDVRYWIQSGATINTSPTFQPILNSQVQTTYVESAEFVEYIKADEILRITSSKEGNTLYTKSWGEMNVKETPEEIFYQSHGKAFQNKMDELLK
jgi:hypothetical protein